jgi:hypothetical protein
MVAAGGVCVMGNDWLAEVGHGGEKLSIFLICSPIFLLAFPSTREILIASFLSLLDTLHSIKIGKTW